MGYRSRNLSPPDPGFWVFTSVPHSLTAVGGFGPNVRDGVFSWREGGHARAMDVMNVLVWSDKQIRLRVGGGILEAVPMTIESYKRFVRPKTMGRVVVGSLAEATALLDQEW
jgi:hypothetical protein